MAEKSSLCFPDHLQKHRNKQTCALSMSCYQQQKKRHQNASKQNKHLTAAQTFWWSGIWIWTGSILFSKIPGNFVSSREISAPSEMTKRKTKHPQDFPALLFGKKRRSPKPSLLYPKHILLSIYHLCSLMFNQSAGDGQSARCSKRWATGPLPNLTHGVAANLHLLASIFI